VTLFAALAGVERYDLATANGLLVEWGHRLGPCERPFRSEAYALTVEGKPVAVAISASAVSAVVGDYRRNEVVELARLCAHPSCPWANRVLLRLWREVCAPRWASWTPQAAVSYSQNAHHTGDLYRFDGWEKVRENCGSTGGGTWSTRRAADAPVAGRKTLWAWRYGASKH